MLSYQRFNIMDKLGYKRLPWSSDHKNETETHSKGIGQARPCRKNRPPVSDTAHLIMTIMLIAAIVAVLLFSPISRCLQDDSSQARFPPLAFRPDGTFQVSIFEDLHFGESTLSSSPVQTDLPPLPSANKPTLFKTRGTPGVPDRTSTQSK